jgi:hypothetical protein
MVVHACNLSTQDSLAYIDCLKIKIKQKPTEVATTKSLMVQVMRTHYTELLKFLNFGSHPKDTVFIF